MVILIKKLCKGLYLSMLLITIFEIKMENSAKAIKVLVESWSFNHIQNNNNNTLFRKHLVSSRRK